MICMLVILLLVTEMMVIASIEFTINHFKNYITYYDSCFVLSIVLNGYTKSLSILDMGKSLRVVIQWRLTNKAHMKNSACGRVG